MASAARVVDAPPKPGRRDAMDAEFAVTFCPASMCPLFAADGSPWTGEKNAPCVGKACGWFGGLSSTNQCDGATAAYEQIVELTMGGRPLVFAKHATRVTRATTFACDRERDCQWQIEAVQRGLKLCPPRSALAAGLDPRVCAY